MGGRAARCRRDTSGPVVQYETLAHAAESVHAGLAERRLCLRTHLTTSTSMALAGPSGNRRYSPPPRVHKRSQVVGQSTDVTIEESVLGSPGRCLNCDAAVQPTRPGPMYCSELCAETAELIRYVRGCRADGRVNQPDVQEAIRIKMALVLGGGYPETARALSDDLRATVYERANWLCENCGVALLRFTQRRGEDGRVERTFFRLLDGGPAEADLDAVAHQHCNGNSNDVADLKAFCKRCNNVDAESKMVPLAADSPQATMARAIVARWEASTPIRLCDDEVNWKTQWRSIRNRLTIAKRPIEFRPGRCRDVGLNDSAFMMCTGVNRTGLVVSRKLAQCLRSVMGT